MKRKHENPEVYVSMRVKVSVLLAHILMISACFGKSQRESGPSKQVVEVQQDRSRLEVMPAGHGVYELTYQRGTAAAAPRVLEILLEHRGLTFESSEIGAALGDAGKELTVQAKSKTLLRVVALSSASVNEIDSGVLATLRFKRTDDAQASIKILTERPVFAPAEANDGLVIGDPLSL